MNALDRWEDRFESEHPRAYRLAEWLVIFAFAVLFVAVLYLAVPEVPAT